ncbi:MAG: MMPL family transporter [Candidatus Omnitrophica bacterium]|nr:MMPL family transporter [Candidatus Omnitrophota bacterium]
MRWLRLLSAFSADHPRLIVGLTVAITLLFGAQFPKITVDTDPKHMLPATSPVRQYNDQVEREFALHPDVVALGIVHPEGVINPHTLKTIAVLTPAIQRIPGVISRDVDSLTSVDNVTAGDGELVVKPAVGDIPQAERALLQLRESLLGNPLLVNRLISADATATAIFIPIEPTANGKAVADKIRALLPKEPGGDQFYLAGDPVARDTFGAEMFRQMALFSPIAGLVMCIALWLMFRSGTVILANMSVAMISIIWSLGGLIGLGYPVHIMSSMSPVFLMAIATDAVHIFNEFAFRMREVHDKRRAVLETMAVVGPPVFYSDVTTAVGFAALATGAIIPVKIFGLVIGFGTVVILLMSYTLVPAILMLMSNKRIAKMARPQTATSSASFQWLSRLGEFCVRRTKWILLAGLGLFVMAVIGLARIHVNNNMVHWFKFHSVVRTADRVLNERLGGTSTAYLVIQAQTDGAMGEPAMLRQIEGLQRELEHDPLVGKTISVADYIKRVNRVLHDDNAAFERIPESAREAGQYLFLLQSAAKPRHLDNVVDFSLQQANIILQLKSWDAGVMEQVMARTKAYLVRHPLPDGAIVKPAGIADFNMVWNHEVLWGMLQSFLWGLVLVLILLVIETRSFLWGLVSFLPLLFTIALIYGVVGLVGKDFDMPVAVLSTLSLGMAIDFAIHFVGRFQQRYREQPDLKAALVWTVMRPGKGIFLNAILFALGFAVMGFADLTPYITVGILMAAVMILSSVMSVIYLPALIQLLKRVLLREGIT